MLTFGVAGCANDAPPPHLYEEYIEADYAWMTAYCDAFDRLACLPEFEAPDPEECAEVRGPRPALDEEDQCIMAVIDGYHGEVESRLRCAIMGLRAVRTCLDEVTTCAEGTSDELNDCLDSADPSDCGEPSMEFLMALDACSPEQVPQDSASNPPAH
jgi:hypothetical protein